jgi:hypothetical protein
MNLHAQIIEESGKPKFAVLPIQEYQALINELSDFENIEDLADYLKALKIKSETKTWYKLEDVKKELGL